MLKVAYNPTTGEAEFHYDEESVERIATTTGDWTKGVSLERTLRGRYVWVRRHPGLPPEVAPLSQHFAATTGDGNPLDAAHVEQFLARYGTTDDILRWREDVGRPLPQA